LHETVTNQNTEMLSQVLISYHIRCWYFNRTACRTGDHASFVHGGPKQLDHCQTPIYIYFTQYFG